MSNVDYIGSTDTLYILTKLSKVLEGYQKTEAGKGLSANDFTDALLAKLNGISDNANKTEFLQITTSNKANHIATITIDGTATDIYSPKTEVDLTMSDTSTNPVENKVVKKYVDDAISSVVSIKFEVVQTLPATGVNGTIYLVPHGGSDPNIYDEFVWIDSEQKWERFGTTDIDLSPYLKIADLVEVSTSDIDTMFNNVFGI